MCHPCDNALYVLDDLHLVLILHEALLSIVDDTSRMTV